MKSLDISTESLHLSQRVPVSIGNVTKPKSISIPKNPRVSILSTDNKGLFDHNGQSFGSPNRRKNYLQTKKTVKLGRVFGFNLNLIKDFNSQRSIESGEKKSKHMRRKGIFLAARAFKKFKNRIYYRNFNNLSDIHFQMIGDKAGSVKETPSFFSKLLNLNFQRKGNLLDSLLRSFLLYFRLHLLKEKVEKLFAYLGKQVPVYDANNPFKIVWDLILMSLTLVRLFTYSIEKCFILDLDIEALGFNLIILQLFNIFVILNTNYYHGGEQITDRRKILRNFIKNHMITEVLPSLGLSFTYFSRSYSVLHDMNLILLLRVANSNELGRRIKGFIIKNNRMESLYTLLILIVKILLWGHLIACIWHYVGVKSIENYPDGVNWLKTKGVADKDWTARYLYSFYWAVTTMLTVGYGDLTPTNEREMMFNIAAMFLGCGMFGYSMNCIGEILKFSGKEEHLLKEKMKLVNNMMKGKNLPSETQIKIRKYMEFVWKQEQKENPEQEKFIMNKLTSNLRAEIYMNTNVKLLKSVPALKNFSDKTLLSLSGYMKKVRFSPEEHVYKEKDYEDLSLYFVIDGTLELIKERDGAKCKAQQPWKTYKKDDYFGVHEFFTGKARALAVVSVDFSTLFQLTRRDILHVLQKNQEELEKFSRIKDMELLYGMCEQYKIKCPFCKREDHALSECYFFSYNPSRLSVVGKFVQKRKKFMKQFRRRDRAKFPTLIKKSACANSLTDFHLMYVDDEELKELTNYYEALFNNENDYERSHKESESPLRLRHLDNISNPSEEDSQSFEDEGKKHETIYPSSLTHIESPSPGRSPRKPTLIITKTFRNNRNLSGSLARLSANDLRTEKKLSVILKPKEMQHDKKKIPDPEILFDKMKQFRYYFPKNNMSHVVLEYNKKARPMKTKTESNHVLKSNLV